MIINTISSNNAKVYEPWHDLISYKDKDGDLNLLIQDVVSNGFAIDLYLDGDGEEKEDIILQICRL